METPSSNKSSSITPDTGSFADVVSIMAILRGPEGCPWDREQTPESLKPYLLEEVYEVLEAIDANDPEALKEELGDLLLQILFHSQMASEAGDFSYQDVKNALSAKLIRRHPHVFQQDGKGSLTTAHEVVRQWDQLKQQEKIEKQEPPSVFATIPKTLPALQRALQVQKRASRMGFDWKTIEPVLEKFKEELDELFAETAGLVDFPNNPQPSQLTTRKRQHIEAELGDVLFSLVNVSRFLRLNPEEALRKATNKFMVRFQYVEAQAIRRGQNMNDCTPQELDQWWEEAKAQESVSTPPTEGGVS